MRAESVTSVLAEIGQFVRCLQDSQRECGTRQNAIYPKERTLNIHLY